MQKALLVTLIDVFSKQEDLVESSLLLAGLKDFINMSNIKCLEDEENIHIGYFLDFFLEAIEYDSLPQDLQYFFSDWSQASSQIPSPYKNEGTFAYQTEPAEVALNDLIVLDEYFFSVSELEVLFARPGANIFLNPHISAENVGARVRVDAEFSGRAKQKLLAHPRLKPYVECYQQKLEEQAQDISPATVNAVIEMLEAFLSQPPGSQNLDASDRARERFLEHKFSLTAEQQAALDNYLIAVPLLAGGSQNLLFSAALLGGNEGNSCIITTQIFLWQFVKTLRPEIEIPDQVKELARRSWLNLGVASSSAAAPIGMQPPGVVHMEPEEFLFLLALARQLGWLNHRGLNASFNLVFSEGFGEENDDDHHHDHDDRPSSGPGPF